MDIHKRTIAVLIFASCWSADGSRAPSIISHVSVAKSATTLT
jgi:hypothetical protein